MELMKMKLRNFRGIKALDMDFQGKDAVIYGANGTGKTTVANAVAYLLTGKASNGEKGFSPKTVGMHKGEHSVEAVFKTEDGWEYTLQKDFHEKWKKPRGGAPILTGHETVLYVNGEKVKDNQYQKVIDTLTGGTDIEPLLLVGSFTEAMGQKDRRAVLFNCFGGDCDAALLDKEEWADVKTALENASSVEAYRKSRESARKSIESLLDTDDDRIEAADSFKVAMPKTDRTVEELEAESSKISEEISFARADVVICERAYQDAKAAFEESMVNNDTEQRIKQIKDRLEWNCKSQESYSKEIANLESELIHLREDFRLRVSNCLWDEANGKCPYCGQYLPDDKLEEARITFESKRAEARDSINAKGKEVSKRLEEVKAKADKEAGESKKLRLELGELKQGRKAVKWEDTPQYAECMEKLNQARAKKDATVALAEKLEELNAIKNAIKTNAEIDAKIAKLKADKEEHLKQLEELEKAVYRADCFMDARAKAMEEHINRNFSNIKFKLFEPQMNGGFKEVCEPMIPNVGGDMIDYKSANTAAQVNANLEIMEALGKAYGVKMPIFIDGAERISSIRKMDCQTVALKVSPQDTVLRIEIVEG